MTTVECSDKYSSDDEFELSLSPLSSLEGASTSAADVVNCRSSNQERLCPSSEEEDSYEQHTSASEERSQTTAASSEGGDDDGAVASNRSCDDGAGASNESRDDDGAGASNQSGDDGDEFCKESCSSTGPPVETAVMIGGQEESTIHVQSESCVIDEPIVLPSTTPKQVPGGCNNTKYMCTRHVYLVDSYTYTRIYSGHENSPFAACCDTIIVTLLSYEQPHVFAGRYPQIWRRLRLSRDCNAPQNIPRYT